MDYYEELAISPSATLDEIHRAHRRLSKLLHPDQQTDHNMKLLAETQMRRLAVSPHPADPMHLDEVSGLADARVSASPRTGEKVAANPGMREALACLFS